MSGSSAVPDAAAVWLLLAAAVLVVVAGTLAAAEAALGRLTRAEAQAMVAARRRGAPAVQALVADPARALSAATLARVTAEAGATGCVVLLAVVWTSRWWVGLVVGAALMGAVAFTALGVSPRTVGRQHPEGVALRAAPRLQVLTTVLGPLARALVALANALTPGRGYRDGPFATEGELRELVDRASESSIIEAGEREMIHSVFELGDTIVREVMSPRTDMVTVAATTTPREALDVFLASGRSRVPVVGESVDDVVGVLHLKDLVRVLHDRVQRAGRTVRPRAGATTAAELARPAVFVPESRQVDALLREMQSASLHLALVVDEYGGIAGLVTLEDLLEEIVGEITDEHDVEAPEVEALDDGFRVSSRLPVDELGDLFGLEVDDAEVDSVGGLLAKALGVLPTPGSRAEVQGLELVADAVDGHRITTVLARRLPDEEPAGERGDRHDARHDAEAPAPVPVGEERS